MRALLAALIVCLVGFASQAQSREIGGPYDMYPVEPAYVVRHVSNHGHATNARRMDRIRSTSHQVAHKNISPIAHIGGGLVTVATAAGEAITVSASFAPKILGFISDLVEAGYVPKDIGCYARGGHMRGSRHYSGNACDFDQLARNKTAPAMYHVRLIAAKWGVRDGCTFRGSPDCGHIDDGHDGYVRYAHHYRHRHHYAGA